MAELEGVPQWKRDLIRRRRGAPGPAGPGAPAPAAQSAARRGPADMLLQAPAHYRLPEPLDYGESREPGAPPGLRDPAPDSGEELTYGPGIVKKLKSRYLSLTLREAGGRARPGLLGLRRAASLELLDEPAPPRCPPRPQSRPARYHRQQRPEAAKRARSVDALVRRDSRSGTEEPPSPPPEPPAPLPPAPPPAQRPKRPPPLLRETERPPPDLVKHALKIFEGAPGKRTKTPNHTGQVADKVKSFTDQRKIEKSERRPAVPPRGPLLSPDRRPPAVATQTTPSLLARPPPSPKKLPLHDVDVRDRSISPVYVIKHPVMLAKLDTSPVKTEFQFPRDDKSVSASPRNTPPVTPDRPPERPSSERNGLRTSTPEPRALPAARPASELSLIAPPPERPPTDDESDSDSSSEDEAVFEVNGEDASTGPARVAGVPQYPRGGHNGVSDDGGARISHVPGIEPPALLALDRVKVPEIENKHKVPESPVTTPPPPLRVPAVVDAKIISPVTPESQPAAPAARDAVPSLARKKIDAIPSPLSPPKERLIPVLKQRRDLACSPALVHYHSPSPPQQLTSREIEKNLINTSKSLEQPLKKVTVTMLDNPDSRIAKRDADRIQEKSVSILETKKQVQIESGVILLDVKEIVVNEVMSGSEVIKESRSVETSVAIVSNGVSPARVGGRKPHWQHQENTMVFNFSNRKEVPDYVENDGIILRSSKREKPKVSNDVISLAGLGGESCTDGSGGANGNESGDEDWTGRPPSPCDVAFENDNVLINGRSNIAAGKTRAKQLKIQFDESLTTTFEYPSEASLGEELLTLTAPASAAPASPLASGGSLSTYTPSKVSLQADSFQLGVTRTQSQPGSERARNGNADISTTNGDATSSLEDSSGEMNSLDPSKGPPRDYLKPCQEGDSHNWSHETHQGDGDLLF